ncbi:MAG: SRPBCC domain-containing protein [Deltaproteobacteria bacterium]
MPDLTLTTSYVIPAPRKRAFEAWIDPIRFADIIAHDPDLAVSDVVIDARVDGRFSYRLGEDTYSGTFRAVEPGETLRFSWQGPQTKAGSYVSMIFRVVAEGCEVDLTHVHFTNSILRDMQLARWDAVLRNLAGVFAR